MSTRRPRLVRSTLLALVALVALPALPSTAAAWAPADTTIAPGVSIAGVPVGELEPAVAKQAVHDAYRAVPIDVVIVGKLYRRAPAALGQVAYVQDAVDRAMLVGRDGNPLPATKNISLTITVNRRKVQLWVRDVAVKAHRPPVSAYYRLRNNRPKIYRERPGFAIRRSPLVRKITNRLRLSGPAVRVIKGADGGILAPLMPKVTWKKLPRVIVIDRSANRLKLWSPHKLLRSYRVATGQPSYPTPLGNFHIVNKVRNPTWTPPNRSWAAGATPIGPGPGNPLGTRWMGLSRPGIGIHGTPDSGSIGTFASHGCIRMRISDVERLFNLVPVGTPVHIVR